MYHPVEIWAHVSKNPVREACHERTSGLRSKFDGPSAWISGTIDSTVISHNWKVLVWSVVVLPWKTCVGGRFELKPTLPPPRLLLALVAVSPYSAFREPRVVGARGALPRM